MTGHRLCSEVEAIERGFSGAECARRQLLPRLEDTVVYKTMYSGFFETELDSIPKSRGIQSLLTCGVSTSVCLESTLRDAMYRDYRRLLVSDCVAEPIGQDLPRSNHDASLLVVELLFGWVTSSTEVIQALRR